MSNSKKVIFIGGTSRSGSTLLDKIISNDPKAMSLGEIHALIEPTRVHHFKLRKEIKSDEKWNKILEGGKKHLYKNLINYFPEVNYFIDSSKDPFWFQYHTKLLIKNNVDVKNVLIFKTINELADSFVKRNILYDWAPFYQNYHKKYFSVIKFFYLVSYKDLINDDVVLENLCRYIGMSYFEDKKKYWFNDRLTFFGSKTVKQSDTATSSLSYKLPNLQIINKYVEEMALKYPEIKKIETYLLNNNNQIVDVSNKRYYNRVYVEILRIKKRIKTSINRIFPKTIVKNN